jgi:hypothetical protein
VRVWRAAQRDPAMSHSVPPILALFAYDRRHERHGSPRSWSPRSSISAAYYLWARPALVAQKLRGFELHAGRPMQKGSQRGPAFAYNVRLYATRSWRSPNRPSAPISTSCASGNRRRPGSGSRSPSAQRERASRTARAFTVSPPSKMGRRCQGRGCRVQSSRARQWLSVLLALGEKP